MFDRHGVQVWLPEAGGPVDVGSPEHRALMAVLGAQSRREVLRSRHRVLAAMEVQAREQGRYLGGRPPYGYRLVDAGPHPNRAHAEWGRRCQRLDPDPVTAPSCEVDVRAACHGSQRGGHRPGAERAGCAVSVRGGSGAESSPERRGVDVADGCGDSCESPVYGAAGVESAAQRALGRFGGTSGGRGGGVGDLDEGGAPAVGQRGGVRGGAAGAGGPADQGRPSSRLSAGRAAAVSLVWAADGFALGTWPSRVPLPARLLQQPSPDAGASEEHLRARRHSAHPARRPRSTRPGRWR